MLVQSAETAESESEAARALAPLTGWREKGLGLSVDVAAPRKVSTDLELLETPRSIGTPRQCMISFLVNDIAEEQDGKVVEAMVEANEENKVRSEVVVQMGARGAEGVVSPIESPREPMSSPTSSGKDIFLVQEGNETKYGCPTCSRLFRVKRDLRHHIKCVHQNFRPFQCDQCGKKFSIKPNLKRHIRTVHEKNRPFYCERCDKSFGLKENFEKHVRMVHERKRPLKCPVCPQDFTARCSLERHLQRHHVDHHHHTTP